MSRRLGELLSKQEIHEALMRYCRGIDRCDVDLVLSAFHEDATDNHSGVVMPVGERVPSSIAAARTNVKSTDHYICNELVHIEGEVAGSEAYVIAHHRIEHEGRELDWLLGVRYVDRFERRHGSWRISHRTVVVDWERFDEIPYPPVGHVVVGMFDHAERAARSRDDYSYQILGNILAAAR
jgi:hypothetical protein